MGLQLSDDQNALYLLLYNERYKMAEQPPIFSPVKNKEEKDPTRDSIFTKEQLIKKVAAMMKDGADERFFKLLEVKEVPLTVQLLIEVG